MLTRCKAVEVLAYTAGLLDGEGSIGIQYRKPTRPGLARKYVATLSIGNTNLEVLRWMQEVWGGSVYVKQTKRPEYQPAWAWMVSNVVAYTVLKEILPYLRIKKPQAELLIEYWEKKKRYNRAVTQNPVDGRIVGHPGAPEAEREWRDSIVQQIRALNHGQQQRLSGVASRTEEATVRPYGKP